jgi:hypothetical protein
MAIRPEFRWLLMTAVIVGLLLSISAMAMDRPNVVWMGGEPACPSCRTTTNMFATRCPTCATDFDWEFAPDEDSPISGHSLSSMEEQELHDATTRLGAEEVKRRVVRALGVAPARAEAYLARLRQGRCGYCGGTGEDLSAESGGECDVCFGRGACIASGGDGRMRLGDESAALAYRRMLAQIEALDGRGSPEMVLPIVRRLCRAFLLAHPGTVEASQTPFWRDAERHAVSRLANDPPSSAADEARGRIEAVLEAVRRPADE